MELYDVLPLFSGMAGITQDEALEFAPVLQKNIEEVLSRIKPGTDIQANKTKLIFAAAGLSFYDYVLDMAVKEPQSSFRAGEVAVSRKLTEQLQAAREYRDRCLLAARECLRYDGVILESVG